ncbi:unnamed protein product [Microthlaspi erraticum]|uniref:Reverse transcriptase zinc-binding domain-containing protein n=1 Tax=Microthlaspi erraticum TaxID=1685480 RepID=A0A6D2JYM8_9BRAS|nr:unnamed protein product [Microthlaspi erraticum]
MNVPEECPLCISHQESHDYLFFECPLSQELWHFFASRISGQDSTTAVSIHSGHHTASSDFYLGAHHHADEVAATSHGLRSVERVECKDFYHNDHANTRLEGCSGPHDSRSTPFLPFAGWHSFSSRIIFCLYLISVMINFGLFHMCGVSF